MEDAIKALHYCREQNDELISQVNIYKQLLSDKSNQIDSLTKEVERLNSQLAKIYMYAEQMSLDLLESSEFIEGSYESLANYKNHMQSLTTH